MEVANLLKVLQRCTTDHAAKIPEETVPQYSQALARLPQPKKPFLPVWSIGPLLSIVPSSHSLRPLRSTIQWRFSTCRGHRTVWNSQLLLLCNCQHRLLRRVSHMWTSKKPQLGRLYFSSWQNQVVFPEVPSISSAYSLLPLSAPVLQMRSLGFKEVSSRVPHMRQWAWDSVLPHGSSSILHHTMPATQGKP